MHSSKSLTSWVAKEVNIDVWAVALSTVEFVGRHIYYSDNELDFLKSNKRYVPVVPKPITLPHLIW